MKTLLAIGLCCAGMVSIASAQSGLRILGAQQFQVDDNNPAHVKTYLSSLNGSLGIDQTGSVTPGVFPSACALLDLASTTQGFLPPRMTSAQELAICGGTPPAGLVVYNTTTNTLDVYNGTMWGASGWALTGNTLSGGSPSTPAQYFGSNNAYDVVMKTNGTERMRIGSSGSVYVGNLTGFGLLNIGRTMTSTIGAATTDAETSLSPSAPSSAQFDGILGNMQINTPNALSGQEIGMFSTVQSATGSTGTLSTIFGAVGNVGNYSGATINRADAVYAQIQSQGTGGIMTDGANYRTGSFIAGTQSITNLRGLYVTNPAVLGTVTNSYGIDIDQLTSATNNTAFRYNHATQPVTISGAGDVQIGGTASIFSPVPGLMVNRNITSVIGGAKLAGEVQLVANPSAANFNQYIGLYAHADAANSNAINGSLYGLWGGAELNTTATAPIGSARGVIAELFYQTSQPLTDGAGINATVDVEGTGTASNLSAVRATFQNNAASTITNLKLLNVLDLFSNAGTITNTYGLYIGDLTLGTQTNTPYSIFAVDAGTRSFVDGKFGFGSYFGGGPAPASDPQTTVDISGSIAIRYQNLSYSWGGGAVSLNTNVQEGFVDVNPTAAGTVISFQNPANGKVLVIHKVAGSAQLTISNEDVAEATPANRIHCMSGANVVINGEALITFIYQGSSGLNRWLIQSISQN